MLRFIAGMALSLLAVLATAGQGVVYEDLNENGLRDADEPGIPGVRVSDGLQIAKTNQDGRWEMDIADEAVIFVIKPTGYATPVNEYQLPQFYYIHRPNGSPEGLRFPGIKPTGPLPDSIDFGLTKQDEPNVFEAILFADTQPQTEAELDYIRDTVVAELVGTDAKFGMTMGDILFDDMSMFPRLNALIGQIGVPWYNVPGNHELNHFAADDRYSLETFISYFGPEYYSFEYGGAHFFVLDNIEYKGHGESDPGDVRGSGGYIANFGERQLTWLQNALEDIPDDALIFMGMHSPLETYISDAPGVTTQDRKKLFKLLSGRKNLYAVAGHTHTTEHLYFGKEDGFKGPGEFHHHVLAAVSGSWWSGPFNDQGIPSSWQRDGAPNGYHVLEVDGNEVQVRFKGVGRDASYQMRIMYDVGYHGIRADGLRDYREGELFDGRMGVRQVPSASVLVNLFDGGPRSQVYFTIAGMDEQSMQRVDRVDPKIQEMFTRHADSKKSWVNATPSSHLWEAELPDSLEPGVYTLSVRAVDEFGNTHHGHSILEITDS
ncbi:MAG: calcineurin-like phosphoesterase family protein [Pseudomonadota bacterium]